ncbi:caspase, EACC1-associated type [Micromonospora sp. NPDC003944]
MSRSRRALLLGCAAYAHPGFAALPAAHHDVRVLGEVLADPRGSAYTVTMRVDCTANEAQRAIEEFLGKAKPDDINLLYLSCHGHQNIRGDLHFVFADTHPDLLGSTSVSAEWVRGQLAASRARSTVVLIDCCFSGAFIRGMRARSSDINVRTLLRDLPQGSGVAVITASGDTELSFEDLSDSGMGREQPSYFTEAVATGIRTGAADFDGDGLITVTELYEYVYHRIVSGPSPQRPRRLGFGEGELIVAVVTPTAPTPLPLPATLLPSTPRHRPSAKDDRTPETHRFVQTAVPLHGKGLLGSVQFDGEWITVRWRGFGPALKKDQQIHLSQVTELAMRPGTVFFHGYLQVVHQGRPPAPVRWGGRFGGRPPLGDPDSMPFSLRQNDAFTALHDAIQIARQSLGVLVPRPDTAEVTATRSSHHQYALESNAPTRIERPAGVKWERTRRTLLLVAIIVFLVGEVGAIGATVTNGYPDWGSTIVGNVGCLAPLIFLFWALVRDLRRRRAPVSYPVAPVGHRASMGPGVSVPEQKASLVAE